MTARESLLSVSTIHNRDLVLRTPNEKLPLQILSDSGPFV